MELLFKILNTEMETPTPYGWFHLVFCVIMVGLTVILCLFFRNCSEKKFKTLFAVAAVVVILLELYKQIVYNFSFEDGALNFRYQWYIFPFQFCSMPFYMFPLLAILPESKVRNAIGAFVATFSLFAGLSVFAYPTQVFIDVIGINIQTMVHHGAQIVMGVFAFAYFRKKFNFKMFGSGICVFTVCVAIAVLLNEIFVNIIPESETFNMFFISRHYNCTLPVLNLVFDKVPYVVAVVLYIIGFSICALVVYLAGKGICRLFSKKKALC